MTIPSKASQASAASPGRPSGDLASIDSSQRGELRVEVRLHLTRARQRLVDVLEEHGDGRVGA